MWEKGPVFTHPLETPPIVRYQPTLEDKSRQTTNGQQNSFIFSFKLTLVHSFICSLHKHLLNNYYLWEKMRKYGIIVMFYFIHL